MGELIAIISLFLFSLNAIVTKAAGSRLDLNVGFLISIAVNTLFAGLLVTLQWLFNGPPVEFSGFGFLMFVISGLLTSYLGRFFYFDSIVKLGPSKASAFMVSNPLFTVLIAWGVLGEILSPQQFIFAFVVLIGLFVVSYIPRSISNKNEESKPRNSLRLWIQSGYLLALLGSIAYALGNITRGTGIQNWNEPLIGGFLGAATGLCLHLIFNKNARAFISTVRGADRKAVGLYVLSGVLTITAQIGQIAAMHYSPISIVTVITMSQALLIMPLSYLILKNEEKLTLRTILGNLLILLGIVMILLD